MFRNSSAAIITLAISCLGMGINFAASILLEKEIFSTYTLLSSQAALLGVFISYGATSLFFNQTVSFCDSVLPIFALSIVAIVIFFILASFFNHDWMYSIAVVMLSLVTLLSTLIAIKNQKESKLASYSFFQSYATLVKFFAMLAVIILSLRGSGNKVAIAGYLFILLFFFSIQIFYILKEKSAFFSFNSPFLFQIKKFLSLKSMYAAWASAIIAFLFVMSIPTVASFKLNRSEVAYFGIYLMYWAGAITGLNAFILNKVAVRFSSDILRSEIEARNSLMNGMRQAFIFSVSISLLLLLFADFSQTIWPEYTEIRDFTFIAAVLIFFKINQAIFALGLSVKSAANYKAIVQVLFYCIFVFLVYLCNLKNALDLLLALLAIEIFVQIAYLFLFKIFWSCNGKLKSSD